MTARGRRTPLLWGAVAVLALLIVSGGILSEDRGTDRAEDIATEGLPQAPEELVAEPGDTVVTLSWSAPPGEVGTIVGYRVQTRQVGGTEWSLGPTTPGVTEVEVIQLDNGVAYEFRVAAENGAGLGEYSAPIGPVTPGPES